MENATNPSALERMTPLRAHCASGDALNWLVARAINVPVAVHKGRVLTPLPCFAAPVLELGVGYKPFRPAGNWAVGGPIKSQHRISTIQKHSGIWVACIYDINDEETFMASSLDELEAAMRCLVLARLGSELEVPSELINSTAGLGPVSSCDRG